MNLQKANFEDILETYYYGTAAHEAARYIGNLIRDGQIMQLATLLRDYRERPIDSAREIKLRAATDRLMNCCSIMEVCSLTSFIPDVQTTDFGREMLPILENKYVQQYYRDFYPTKLPQLFRWRLAGSNDAIERQEHDSGRSMLAFLALDQRFMEKLDDHYFLRMLDSFCIQGYWFSDVARLIGKPEEFISRILLPPKERDVLSLALAEFSLFMQFCFDLRQLLSFSDSQPLLQSAMWNHYCYWFDIIGQELADQLGEALSQFLKWGPEGDNADAAKAVQAYVADARTVLVTLTSHEFAKPVDQLLKEVSARGSISEPQRDQAVHFAQKYTRVASAVVVEQIAKTNAVARRKKLGLYVSKYSKARSSDNPWFEFHTFVRKYWPLLSDYTLLVSEPTAELLHEIGGDLKHLLGVEPQWDLELFTNSRSLLTFLVQTNKEEVERVLLFLEPDKLRDEWAPLWFLRQTAAERNQALNINRSAALWGEWEWAVRRKRQDNLKIGAEDTIVLVEEQAGTGLDQFALKHLETVISFPRCILPGGTQAATAALLKVPHRPHDLRVITSGEVFGIAGALLNDYCDTSRTYDQDKICHVIAFADYSGERVSRTAFETFLMTCADSRMRVNLLPNEASAEDWIQRLKLDRLLQ